MKTCNCKYLRIRVDLEAFTFITILTGDFPTSPLSIPEVPSTCSQRWWNQRSYLVVPGSHPDKFSAEIKTRNLRSVSWCWNQICNSSRLPRCSHEFSDLFVSTGNCFRARKMFCALSGKDIKCLSVFPVKHAIASSSWELRCIMSGK